jgi:hypothetical protein
MLDDLLAVVFYPPVTVVLSVLIGIGLAKIADHYDWWP